MQTTTGFILSADDFADIVDVAGYVIGYWADYGFYYDEDKRQPPYYLVSTMEDGRFKLTKEDIEDAMRLILGDSNISAHRIRMDVSQAIAENDMGYIDGYAADAIIQVACFKEIIYG